MEIHAHEIDDAIKDANDKIVEAYKILSTVTTKIATDDLNYNESYFSKLGNASSKLLDIILMKL